MQVRLIASQTGQSIGTLETPACPRKDEMIKYGGTYRRVLDVLHVNNTNDVRVVVGVEVMNLPVYFQE